jgi:hypothetical protein
MSPFASGRQSLPRRAAQCPSPRPEFPHLARMLAGLESIAVAERRTAEILGMQRRSFQ